MSTLTPGAIAIQIEAAPPRTEWDAYVSQHRHGKAYHHSAWPLAVADLFKLERYFVSVRNATGQIVGILPLVRQKSLLFGDRLTSLPFFNYGGALADDEHTRGRLMDEAVTLGRSLGADQVEFRDVASPPPGWPTRLDKVTMLLDLPPTHAALGKQLGSKLRSQVKRAQRETIEVRVGGAELVPDFYRPFSAVMRDLGTPVYPRRFFEQLAERLAEQSMIVTLHLDGRPVSAAYLVQYRDTMEIPWAATIAEVKARSTNMLLYAEALKLAIERGCRRFDFGRSTVDSGPYRFKQQWGAQPVQLHWAYWRADGRTEAATGISSNFRERAIKAWSRLPLTVANRLGPLVSPTLPW